MLVEESAWRKWLKNNCYLCGILTDITKLTILQLCIYIFWGASSLLCVE